MFAPDLQETVVSIVMLKSPPSPPTYEGTSNGKKVRKNFNPSDGAGLEHNSLLQPPTYLRNIEKGKKEKKSWYQYIFLGVAWENEATEEVRRMGVSAPYRPINRPRLSQ
jgi:hypothetical protein